tara:strand:+ start:9751 stop:11721 length:1971 start_codon:yes stop_codon:yes gene_type:complete
MSKSGYRFIPLNNKVVPAPIALDEIRHDRPVPGTLTGEMTVEWTADTPLCVASGVKNADGEHENVFIADDEKGKGRTYVLPGSTTGGAIRAVSEIAGFAHLGPINADRKYGTRAMIGKNSTAGGGDDDVRLDTSASKIRMAWLEWVPDTPDTDTEITMKSGEGSWRIYHAGDSRTRDNIYLVKFAELSRYFQVDVADWAHKQSPEKAKLLAKASLISKVNFIGTPPSGRSGYHKPFVGELDKTGSVAVTGYVVCTGATVSEDKPKAHEYLFLPPKRDAASYDVHPEIMHEFNKLYTTPSNDGGVPLESWRFWLSQIGHLKWLSKAKSVDKRAYDKAFGRRIPVFYTAIDGSELHSLADARTMHDAGVCFGLSPVLRKPNIYTVGDIAKRTYGGQEAETYRVPAFSQGGLGWDMPTAMFGAVEGVDQDRLSKQDDTARAALKGRVSFGFAISTNAEPGEVKKGVFGVPRPSFEPYYLTGADGYNDGDSRLSGRKRYPVRSKVNEFVIPNDNPDTQEAVRFLKSGAKFTQTIKFKNLRQEELGLLLWAICFGNGKNTGQYRHAIGRAKGHGYGSMKTEITRLVSNEEDKAETAIDAFKAYVLKALDEDSREFEKLEQIQKLLAYADPNNGDQNANKLTYPALTDFANIRDRGLKLQDF